ncbi:MAG: FAD-binding oxidoreductase [Pseudomonas sp.]|uniref:FAD-binding oxidoreductase n=1 Tax=Pseudomonas sp. TaxID=306 RepID=UPI0039827785
MSEVFPAHVQWCDDAALCRAFAADQSLGQGCLPKAVVKPRNVDELIAVLQWANSTGTGVVPVSSTGCRRRGDTLAKNDNTVIVDLSGMRKLIHVDARDKIAIIEPGVDFASIDGLLAPHGLRAFRPLAPRGGKSLIASYLEREPILAANDHWDVADPFGGTGVVLGNGKYAPTGGAAIEGTLAEQLARGHRHMQPVGPINLDILRVLQGAQGSLGIMAWAAIYCERIPTLEESWFVTADTLEPVIEVARDVLMRRLGSQVFIVDKVQLALLLCEDRVAFDLLLPALPQWILFVSLSAHQYAPAEKMAWQVEQLNACVAPHGAMLQQSLAGHGANDLAGLLRRSESSFFRDRLAGNHLELFFLQQLDRVTSFSALVRSSLDNDGFADMPLGTYIQPMAQGTYCHVEFTVPYGRDGLSRGDELMSTWRATAERCADAGGFFSRPYGDWSDIAFSRAGETQPLLSMTKSIFDPGNVMSPGRLPY